MLELLFIKAAITISITRKMKKNITDTLLEFPLIIPNNGRWFKDSTTGLQTLMGFDITVKNGNHNESYRIIEQNPNKKDKFGNLTQMANTVRNGNQIIWIIDRESKINPFLGRIENGVFIQHTSYVAAKLTNRHQLPQNIDNISTNNQTYENEEGWEGEQMDVSQQQVV